MNISIYKSGILLCKPGGITNKLPKTVFGVSDEKFLGV